MSVSFAPARSIARSPVARALSPQAARTPANDHATGEDDQVLHAALLHFAQHGLGAARAAYAEVERAVAAGDASGAQNWLAICRTFDRRLAGTLEARIAATSASATTVI